MKKKGISLVNTTHWNTRDLRKLIAAGLRANGMEPAGYPVGVEYRRRRGRHGYGWVGARGFTLRLPGRTECLQRAQVFGTAPDHLDGKNLAHTINHEIAHNRGLRHRDMGYGIGTDWAKGFVVRWTPPVKKTITTEERIVAREAHAARMLAKAETRLKRAKTIYRKWAQKVRYYERRTKAAAKKEDSHGV